MSVIEIIFPKTRAELFRLLFADPSREFHLRELARLSRLSIGSLQQEVSKLSAAGLLTQRRDGNRLYFRANVAHAIFPELRGIAIKETGLRNELVKALGCLPGITLALVFGSQASGEAKPESDIDLLVIGTVGLRQLAPVLRPVAESLHREINPHALSPTSFHAKAAAGDAFITSVLSGEKLFIIGGPDELGAMV